MNKPKFNEYYFDIIDTETYKIFNQKEVMPS